MVSVCPRVRDCVRARGQCAHECVHVCTCVWTCVPMNMCMHAPAHASVCMHVHMRVQAPGMASPMRSLDAQTTTDTLVSSQRQPGFIPHQK